MGFWAHGAEPQETFIWFAEADISFFRALERHMVPLRNTEPIDPWHVGLIAPGHPVAPERASRVLSAKLFLVLVSADLLASEEFQDEATIAFHRRDQKEAAIVPIVLRACDWRSTALGELTPLPHDGEPIASAENDAAWLAVIEGLRGVLRSMYAGAP
jgi:hypothetical protein